MKTLITLALAAILMLLTHNTSMSQESEWPDLQLRDGIAGEDYNVYHTNLLRALQKKVGLFQVSYALPNPNGFYWEVAEGQLPPGLVIEKNGDVSGTPLRSAVRELPYVFRVRFSDREFAKEINVIMRISIPRLVLPKTDAQQNYRSESVQSASASGPSTEELGADPLPSGEPVKFRESVSQQSEDPVVAELKKALTSDDPDIKKHAAIYLSRLGAQALSALPELMKNLNDKDEAVRKAASNAIDHIQTVSGETTSFSVTGSVTDDTGSRIPHVRIVVTGEGKELATASDNDGDYEIGPLPRGSYSLTARPDPKYYSDFVLDLPAAEGSNLPFDIQLQSKRILRGGQFSRVVLGYEQAGASASNSAQKFFMDLFISTPLGVSSNPKSDYEPKWRLWGDARITSVPQQNLATAGNSTLRDFTQNFGSRFFDLKINEVAQAAEVTAGVEYRLWGSDILLPSTPLETRNRFTVSLIAGGGIITPITPRDSSAVFSVDKNISPDVFKQFNLPDSTKFVAFVNPDRDRFFRQYYGGLRLKTMYFDAGGRDIDRNPGTLDLTFGQNEAITGGRLRGGVMRLDGFFPLPIEKAKYVFLYGTALMRLTRSRISDPLILSPAPGTPVPGPDTAIITVPQTNRDYYKIGIGIDPIGLFKCVVHNCNARPN